MNLATRKPSPHAEELARAAGVLGFPRPSASSENLYDRLGEVRFLTFVHAGVRRGRIEFETYARLLRRRGGEALADLFDSLVQDERQHEAYSARLLEELIGEAGARRAVRWVTRWEAWRTFRRHGRALGGALYWATMLLVYVALAPFGLALRLTAKPSRGFSREP